MRELDAGELPGAVVFARMGPELSCELAVGAAVLAPERHEARSGTVYDLASLTKVMATTAACMLLVAERKLDLDQRVGEFLPHFSDAPKEKITLRHLLTHSSGLRPWRAYHADLRERELRRGETLLTTREGRDSIVDRVLRSAPLHEPGEASIYSDLGFIALGELVERVAGEPLDRFCERRVFEPLGMSRTRFQAVPFEGARAEYAATEMCGWREKILWGEVHDPNAWAMGGVAGHAGLFGTAADVMRFADEMLAAEQDRSEVFDAATAREFFRRQETAGGSDWALGWSTPTPGQSTSGTHFSSRSIGHTGFTGTSLWIDLERDMVVVLLSNRVHQVAKRSRFTLRPRVHDLIWEAFLAA
ncbi:MAG: serine hydrolase [Proteobacteria bacterium]|nr:serine hydrolase [Pseudomonadota bacterium]